MTVDLAKYKSYCQPDQKIIISRDVKSDCHHRAENPGKHLVRQYHIDGEVIPDQNTEKCDWMVLNDTEKDAYLIELKGSDIHKAERQIDSTYGIMKSELPDYQFFFRIVYRTGTQRLNDQATIRWKEKCKRQKCDVIIGQKEIKDIIS
ncbi:MAG: hypothetical protein IJB52_09335 [Clostridia bacterium]|nr:hypothetical protein [Clostridia bacterium]